MPKMEVPVAVIERNKTWVEAVTTTLGESGDSTLARRVMKNAGKNCAVQLLEKTVAHFGRMPNSVEELVEAINLRRKELLKATNFWVIDGDQASFKLDTCGCDLVEACLVEPNKTFCQCSAGMFESLFQRFWQGQVNVEIVKAIGMGDDCCEFIVYLDD